jgi:hypothetical protein
LTAAGTGDGDTQFVPTIDLPRALHASEVSCQQVANLFQLGDRPLLVPLGAIEVGARVTIVGAGAAVGSRSPARTTEQRPVRPRKHSKTPVILFIDLFIDALLLQSRTNAHRGSNSRREGSLH